MFAGPVCRLPVSQPTRLPRVRVLNTPDHAMYGTRSGFRAFEPGAQRRRQCGPRLGRRGERIRQRLAVGESLRRVARETPVDRGAERRWQPGRGAHHARRRLGRLSHQQRGQVGRLEGQTAAHREIADHAERVEVAASIDGCARGLLGTHEVRGPRDLPRVGRGRGIPAAVGDAEVGHQRAARAAPRAGCCPASRRGARCRVRARRRAPTPPRAARASRRPAAADRACGVARPASRPRRSS